MTKISICLGSACHLKGAPAVLRAFSNLLNRYQIQAQVELEGNFCQNHCTEGVVVKINDMIITHVSPDKVHKIFIEHVMNQGEKTI